MAIETFGQRVTDALTDVRTATPIMPGVRDLRVGITHEIGPTFIGSTTATEQRMVPPSDAPTRITFFSNVVQSSAARTMRSPAYLASVRRRHMKSLAKEIESWGRQVDRLDFAAVTLPVFERLRDLVAKTLIDIDTEGNTREILRRLRDTLLDGGSNHYRRPEVRGAAVQVLQQLGELEEVTPKHVANAVDLLRRQKLATVALGPILDADAESDEEILD
jgi:hypothetical protein